MFFHKELGRGITRAACIREKGIYKLATTLHAMKDKVSIKPFDTKYDFTERFKEIHVRGGAFEYLHQNHSNSDLSFTCFFQVNIIFETNAFRFPFFFVSAKIASCLLLEGLV